MKPATASMRPRATRRNLRRDERWLADVWARQSFERRHLQTTSGLSFKVVFPGMWTGEAGPDFRDAILALSDGSLLRGDVELHLESRGWRQHGHHLDPVYDEVLLHVVLEDDEPARNSADEPVLTLELAGRLGPSRDDPRPAAPEGPQLSYVLAPCQGALPARGVDGVRQLISELALERFKAKQAVYEGELAVHDPDQVLYAGLMEALGYSRNRQSFRELAGYLPLSALEPAQNQRRAEPVMLVAAGLEESRSVDSLSEIGLPLPPPTLRWQCVGVRPDNLPASRIRQFAAILARLLPARLLDELLAPLVEIGESAFPEGIRQVRLTWHQQLQEVGPQRADAMAVNVLLPFAAAYGQATCQFQLSDMAVQAFLAYPPEGANQVTRYMRNEILGPLSAAASGAAGEQGLLHVWDNWCHEKVCALCPLAKRS